MSEQCPACGKEVIEEGRFCASCGASLSGNGDYSSTAGRIIPGSPALTITTALLIVGSLLILVSTFLPWYQWNVDATPLAEKLSHLDPAIVAKYAEGSRSADDILANYGDMGPGSLHGSDNLWQLAIGGNTDILLLALLMTTSTMTIAGLAFFCIVRQGCEVSARRMLVSAVALGIAAISLGALWFRLLHLDSQWWASYPAGNAAAEAWRQDAMDIGFFRIVTQPGYGHWLALAAFLVMSAGTVTAFLKTSRAREGVDPAASIPSPS